MYVDEVDSYNKKEIHLVIAYFRCLLYLGF